MASTAFKGAVISKMQNPRDALGPEPWGKNQIRENFRKEVTRIMLQNGADEAFVWRTLTDRVIETSLKNGFSAESVAWALLQ